MRTKICSKCHSELPITEFYRQSKSKDGLYCYCKNCSYQLHNEWRKSNVIKMREYNVKSWHKHREAKLKYEEIRTSKRQEFLDTLKTPCAKCGETRVWVLQFHHVNPEEKSFGISDGKNFHKSKEALIEEAKKTICLCANCHKEFHHFYGQKPLHPIEDLKEYIHKAERNMIEEEVE